MGIILSAISAVCCAWNTAMCACSCFTCCFRGATKEGGIARPVAKLFYLIFLGISTIVALILKYEGYNMGIHNSIISAGCISTNTTSTGVGFTSIEVPELLQPQVGGIESFYTGVDAEAYCVGDAAVFRISFMLTIFFSLMLCLSEVSESLFRGFWGFKIILFIGGLIGCFFIPTYVFANGGFAWVARISSTLFLLIQILILIDFGYQLNEDWVEKAYEGALTDNSDATRKEYLFLILGLAFLLYIFSVVGIVLLYIHYGTCDTNTAYITICLILSLIVTVITFVRDKMIGEPGAILPTAIVVAYNVYLTWSAMQSNPDETCGCLSLSTLQQIPCEEAGSDFTTIMIGAAVASLSLMWTSLSVSQNVESLVTGNTDENEGVLDAEGNHQAFYRVDDNNETKAVSDLESNHTTANVDNINKDDDNTEKPTNDKTWLFFLLLTVASLYMAMLFTNWGEDSDDPTGRIGAASMWVKLISCWLCYILYFWTLIAPGVCGNREFS